MRKRIISYIALLLLTMSCSLELVENTKSLLSSCSEATGVAASAQSATPLNVAMSLTGSTSDISSVVWQITKSGTEYYRSTTTTSPFSLTSSTLSTDGTFTITATVTTQCGKSYSLSGSYTYTNKTCTKATGITASVQTLTPLNLNLALVGTISDIASVVWSISKSGTTIYESSSITSSPFSIASNAITTDGLFNIVASITSTCGETYTLTTTYNYTKSCSKPTGIEVVSLADTPLDLTLKLTGTTSDIASVAWSVEKNSVSYYQSGSQTIAPFTVTTPTLTTDGTFTITAQLVDKCGTSYTLTTSYTYTISSSLIIPMIYVEGGTFQMGSTTTGNPDEEPVHSVTLSNFSIGKYEVTQAEWKAVMGANPSYFTPCDNCPVEYVSWNAIQTYLKKLNALTGKIYRLPTEAEWEYAARGGKLSKGYFFSGSNTIDDVAWYWSNSSYKTHVVGQKTPNELGIYDMTGNVYEWCSDWYGSYTASSQTNPTGPSSGSYRVMRGSCWNIERPYCQVTIRNNLSSHIGSTVVGFRVVSSQ